MKRLYILRHAKAMPAEGESDAERRLAPKGEQDAQSLGKIMSGKSYAPDLIYCSPARRTKETMEGLCQTLGEIKTKLEPKIYSASQGDLFTLIQNAEPSCETLILIGHNPAIHQLAATLATEDDT